MSHISIRSRILVEGSRELIVDIMYLKTYTQKMFCVKNFASCYRTLMSVCRLVGWFNVWPFPKITDKLNVNALIGALVFSACFLPYFVVLCIFCENRAEKGLKAPPPSSIQWVIQGMVEGFCYSPPPGRS